MDKRRSQADTNLKHGIAAKKRPTLQKMTSYVISSSCVWFKVYGVFAQMENRYLSISSHTHTKINLPTRTSCHLHLMKEQFPDLRLFETVGSGCMNLCWVIFCGRFTRKIFLWDASGKSDAWWTYWEIWQGRQRSFSGARNRAAVSKIPGMPREHGILWPGQDVEETQGKSEEKCAGQHLKPFAHLSISIPDDCTQVTGLFTVSMAAISQLYWEPVDQGNKRVITQIVNQIIHKLLNLEEVPSLCKMHSHKFAVQCSSSYTLLSKALCLLSSWKERERQVGRQTDRQTDRDRQERKGMSSPQPSVTSAGNLIINDIIVWLCSWYGGERLH